MKHAGVMMLAAVVLGACGGGDDESALVGIWEITGRSQNMTGCDTPGEPVTNTGTPYLAVLDQAFFGQRFLSAVSCVELEECRDLIDDSETLHLGTYNFERGSDADGWRGTVTYAFEDGEGTCTGTVNQHTMQGDGGDLVIDTTMVEVTGVPLDADGFCDTDAAAEMAEGQPCSGREVVTAARVE